MTELTEGSINILEVLRRRKIPGLQLVEDVINIRSTKVWYIFGGWRRVGDRVLNDDVQARVMLIFREK